MFQFYKGRTNQHLTWLMVDQTDFATPESALSAAMKIKIWGKLRGAAGVNFVSSGTGSLTNDVVHVGPSVLGLYTIALAKADLSDASAAWYDQYIVVLSATGAAQQVLIADGGIDLSAISAYQSRLSDLYSLLSDLQSDFQSRVPKRVATDSQLSDVASDLRSLMATTGIALTASAMSDVASQVWAHAVGTRVDSRILVAQSFLSDIRSHVSDLQSDFQSRVPKLVATNSQLSDLASDVKSAVAGITASVSASDISDIASAVWANTIGARVDSRILVAQSFLSDIRSHVSDLQSDFQSRVPKLVATNSQLSDLASDVKSAVAGITATLSVSDISDIASAVWANAIGARVDSRILVAQSFLSDIRSSVSDLASDLLSVLTTTGVQLNASSLSDLRSAIAAITASVSTSDISDIASAVRAALVSDLSDILSAAQQTNSRVLVAQSFLSDIRSHVSDLQSDFQSRVPKAVATNSQLSDLHSDLRSFITAGVALDASSMSDLRSAIAGVTAAVSASDMSDIASRVDVLLASRLSDILSAAQQTNSRVLVTQSMVSDTQSKLSDVESNLLSLLTTTGVQLNASVMSDIRSAVQAVTVNLTASDISDIASAVLAGAGATVLSASDMSDIASRVWAMAAATALTSRVLVIASQASDILSLVSDLQSDFQSRVPKRVATDSQLSDLASDIRSAVLIVQSMASDAASAAIQTNSRVLLNQSRISDVYSMLSDLQSDFQSRVPKLVATNSQLSDLASDVKSAVAAGALTLDASALSDIGSAVWANAIGARVDSRLLVVKSQASDVYSMVSDLQSDFQSRVPKRVATDSQLSALSSDVLSAIAAGVPVSASDMSDIRSALGNLPTALQIAGKVWDEPEINHLVVGSFGYEQQFAEARIQLFLDAAVSSRPTAAAIADAVWDEPTAGHATAGSYGDKIGAHEATILKAVLTAGSTTTSIRLNATTGIDGGAPSTTDDFYNGRTLIFTSGALAGQATSIVDYVGATKILTVVALTDAPASGVTAVIA